MKTAIVVKVWIWMFFYLVYIFLFSTLFRLFVSRLQDKQVDSKLLAILLDMIIRRCPYKNHA